MQLYTHVNLSIIFYFLTLYWINVSISYQVCFSLNCIYVTYIAPIIAVLKIINLYVPNIGIFQVI